MSGNEGPLVVDSEVVRAKPNVHHQDAVDAQGQGRAAPPAAVHQLFNVDEDTNTIIDPGKPEPGRDIFANGRGEVQSGTVPPPARKAGGAEEVKQISSVFVVAQNVEVERGLTDQDEEEGRKEDGKGFTVAMDLNGGTGTGPHSSKEREPENDDESPKEESKFWTEPRPLSEEVLAAAAVVEAAAGLEIPMGPHDEAGEVREKVAEELFGDDVDE